MTEFTKEFIEEQRKIIRNGTMTALQMKGNNEIDLHINMMYRRAKQEHCEKYYPEALDHIEHLQARVQELEEALAKIANYESMRFKLSPYEYGLLEQIVGIAEHALRDGE
jgi:hypothetical protein